MGRKIPTEIVAQLLSYTNNLHLVSQISAGLMASDPWVLMMALLLSVFSTSGGAAVEQRSLPVPVL